MALLAVLEDYRGYIRVFVILVFWYFIHTRRRPYLSKIPGPFLASISGLTRLLSVAKGSRQEVDIALHEQYGPLVRVAPRVVSIADASAIPVIYSASTKFEKSDFYVPFDPKTSHGWMSSVFSVRSERVHRDMKRPMAGAYSMTTLLELEGLTDQCIAVFERKMEEKLKANGSTGGSVEVDLSEWMHWYAFDVILSVTFSKHLGFMENEADMHGIISAIEQRLRYNATIGQIPWLHWWLFGNNTVAKILNMIPALAKMNTSARIVKFTAQQMDRYKQDDNKENPSDNGQYLDMLHRFKTTKDDGEVIMNDLDLLIAASGNIFAGADTTAISLRSLFYYLLRNPLCLKKLQAEIDNMDKQGKLSEIVTFTESNQMSYMQACLKEAMRMHPAVGMLLERIVPENGVTIADKFIPAGTVVGINPWVVARDREVYGQDIHKFRPERWTDVWTQAEKEGEEGEEAKTRMKLMERNFLAFGTGSRSCLGKNISLLEMNKLVPQIFRRFKLELVDPKKDWTVENYWFTKQTGVKCRISKRGSGHI